MPGRPKHRLAELQLAIMQVLWEKGEASVGDVRDSLEPARSLAYTTVGTMLAKLEEKGQVSHRTDGRVNIYRPRIDQDQVRRSMITDLANRLFQGDVAKMACHLLNGAAITRDDLAQLKSLIRRKESELKDAD